MVRVRAPEFPKDGSWLNIGSPDRALSLANFRQRIVLLDFWTYCCINCLHVLPDLKYLEQKYKAHLTVLGIHSAKFDHEANLASIRQAILRYDIEHPVLIDDQFKVWDQYAIKAYPTFVLIDPQGYIVGTLSGEGRRAILDETIATLITQHEDHLQLNPIAFTLEKQQQAILSPIAFPGKVLAHADRLFIADTGHHRIIVTTLNGEVIQVIGNGDAGSIDGAVPAELRPALIADAQFSSPQGLAIDGQLLYVADSGNHTIRAIDLIHETVRTIAGTGEQSQILHPHGGKALETALNSPWDIELVGKQLFIANAGSHQIWCLNLAAGTLETFVGTGAEGCMDGDRAEAAFAQPSGLTQASGSLFSADSETSTIRTIALQDGRSSTLCGSGDLYGFGDVDGVGDAVRLQHCLGVACRGNHLWIADTYNHKIKRVDRRSGECQTILGSGQAGAIDRPGTQAQFFEPSGISVTDTHLYIADTNNHAIRSVELATLKVSTIDFPNLCAPNLCFPK